MQNANPAPEAEGRGLAGEAAAATSDIAGEILKAPFIASWQAMALATSSRG